MNDREDRRRDPWDDDGPSGPPDLDEVLRKLRSWLGGGRSGGGRSGGIGGASGRFIGLVAAAVIGVLALIGVVSGFYQLDQQERGVIMRFGAVLDDLQTPGLRWNWPLIDEVHRVNVTRVNHISSESVMLTEDENIVDVKLSVQYRIADPGKYIIEVRDPELSLEHAAESALRHVVGSSSMNDVLTEGREQVAIEVEQKLQSYMDNYGTGIEVVKVNIDDSQPPRQVASAFDDVQKAQEDNQRLVNEADAYLQSIIPEARGEAVKQTEQAQAYKERAIARAQGEAERFTQLLKQYQLARDVTRDRLYIETMEKVLANSTKVLIDSESGNNLLYLPLDRLVQEKTGGLRIDIDPETVRELGGLSLPEPVRGLIRRGSNDNSRGDRSGNSSSRGNSTGGRQP